ncbi:DUF4168 domain-containing protein, partial [Salmonella enterica]|uniref:DUF4168 domain-containing protein n=1 Tax=Salmonella enterica TaxID=28901 RepID=UPI003299DA74
LEKFAEVQEDLQDITMEYQQKMQEEGETPEARMNVQQEYQREITQAVNDAGLSAQQYNRIQSQVMTDPQLQERVQEMM